MADVEEVDGTAEVPEAPITLPIVLKLNHPVQRGTEEITELKAERRLQAKDFRGIKSTEIMFDDMLTMISRLFTVPPSVVNELDVTDMMAAGEVINGFFGSGPKTGGTQ
jgi:Phage tail assembly chaperone proteins, E, or 41 or 14